MNIPIHTALYHTKLHPMNIVIHVYCFRFKTFILLRNINVIYKGVSTRANQTSNQALKPLNKEFGKKYQLH